VDVKDDNEAQLLKFYRMLSDSKKDDAMTYMEWLVEKESENGNKI
jgi:type VI protein secretion system component VasK